MRIGVMQGGFCHPLKDVISCFPQALETGVSLGSSGIRGRDRVDYDALSESENPVGTDSGQRSSPFV